MNGKKLLAEAVMVWANWEAPPSGRSSLVTEVIKLRDAIQFIFRLEEVQCGGRAGSGNGGYTAS